MPGQGPLAGEPRERKYHRPLTARIGVWLVWWVLLMSLWVMLDDSLATDELLAGAGAAAIAALVAELAGYQAAALSGRTPPPGCRALLDWLAAIIGPIDGDRPFGEDIERLIQAPRPPD